MAENVQELETEVVQTVRRRGRAAETASEQPEIEAGVADDAVRVVTEDVVEAETDAVAAHDAATVDTLEQEDPSTIEREEENAEVALAAEGETETTLSEAQVEESKATENASVTNSEEKDGRTQALRGEREKVLNQTALADAGQTTATNARIKGIVQASREDKRAMYSDGGIIPLGDELKFKSEGQKRREDYISLVGSKKSHSLLSGTIYSISTYDNKICAVVQHGCFRILIPSERLLSQRETKSIQAVSDPSEKLNMRRRFTMQRIGSEIDFIVSAVDEQNKVAVADRLEAMDLKKQAWYLQHDHSGELALIKGKRVEARVVVSTRNMMIVEVFGMEYVLREHDIAYVQVPNISDEYPVGSTVPVIFTKLDRERTDEGMVIHAQVSVKEALPDPRKHGFDSVQVKDYSSGTVTGITDYGIIVRLGGMSGTHDVLCQFQRTAPSPGRSPEIPEIGRNVIIRIRKKDEFDSHKQPIYRVYGDIVKLL